MAQALESDVSAADQALNVVIYDGTVFQPYLSEQAGRPIHHDAVFIRIQASGDKLNIIDRPIEEADKRRFPLHWAHYQNQTKDEEHPGTPLSEIPGLTKGALLNMKAMGFYTVEQFAAASDQVLQGLGMSAGVSPLAFRDKCKQFLGAAADMAPITQMQGELAQRDAKIAAMQAQLEQLIALQSPPAPTPQEVVAAMPVPPMLPAVEPPAFTDEVEGPGTAVPAPKLGLGALKGKAA